MNIASPLEAREAWSNHGHRAGQGKGSIAAPHVPGLWSGSDGSIVTPRSSWIIFIYIHIYIHIYIVYYVCIYIYIIYIYTYIHNILFMFFKTRLICNTDMALLLLGDFFFGETCQVYAQCAMTLSDPVPHRSRATGAVNPWQCHGWWDDGWYQSMKSHDINRDNKNR